MKKDQKKRITVGDLVYKTHQKDEGKGNIDSDTIRKVRELNEFPEMPDVNEIEFIRPDQRVYDTLLEIKQQGETRKKEVGVFIFNAIDKTIIRDTDTRTFEYKFLNKGMNFKLVKILIDKETYHQTRHLKKEIGSKSDDAIRKKVGEINEKIRDSLRMDDDFKFIIGESGSGYKINPNIKIRVIE